MPCAASPSLTSPWPAISPPNGSPPSTLPSARSDLSDAVEAAGAGSLAAADGTFSVAQMVTGVPGGPDEAEEEVRVVLTVTDGRARLVLDPGHTVPSTATIVLGYGDALAMARGELDPADALAAGRVRVRGDLAALVAGQDVLAAASARLGSELLGLTDTADSADSADSADTTTGEAPRPLRLTERPHVARSRRSGKASARPGLHGDRVGSRALGRGCAGRPA